MPKPIIPSFHYSSIPKDHIFAPMGVSIAFLHQTTYGSHKDDLLVRFPILFVKVLNLPTDLS